MREALLGGVGFQQVDAIFITTTALHRKHFGGLFSKLRPGQRRTGYRSARMPPAVPRCALRCRRRPADRPSLRGFSNGDRHQTGIPGCGRGRDVRDAGSGGEGSVVMFHFTVRRLASSYCRDRHMAKNLTPLLNINQNVPPQQQLSDIIVSSNGFSSPIPSLSSAQLLNDTPSGWTTQPINDGS